MKSHPSGMFCITAYVNEIGGLADCLQCIDLAAMLKQPTSPVRITDN